MEKSVEVKPINEEYSTSQTILWPWSQKTATIVNKSSGNIDYEKRTLAAHAFLYCKSSAILFKVIDMKYGIMMQLRFDGTLGFPGGLIEKGELPVIGLNRELTEEIGLEEKYYLTEENYFCSWVSETLVDHFYVKQFSEEDFISIEKTVLESQDWGGETLGIVRVPVHELKKHSKISPFAAFLCHRFISNAQEQLIESIVHQNILSKSEVQSLWDTVVEQQT